MELRPLGNSGLRVAPLAFGGNVFGWTADEATSFRLLDAFVGGLALQRLYARGLACYRVWMIERPEEEAP